MHRILRLCFGLHDRVDRATYLLYGGFLLGLKYTVDMALFRLATGRTWTPAAYLSPLFTTRFWDTGGVPVPRAPSWLWIVLVAWALPFLWVGVSMTLRRAIDAGFSPWTCLVFFVPLANWILIALLCIAPPRPGTLRSEHVHTLTRLRAALLGVAAGVGIGVISFGLQVLLLKSYNAAVFLGTPFTMGAAAGYIYSRGQHMRRTAAIGALTVVIAALATLLFALEGLVCILMALPIALPLGALGALLGEAIAREHWASSPASMALFVLLVPISGALEQPKPPLREVSTAIEIDAPPERVWPHVVAFAEIDAPPQWFFRLGIAHPVRARLSGTGVGAVRRCEFSTGPFVEPITVWEEPRRLAFSVAHEPPPLHEWSPYHHVYAQHLVDTLRSRRGEFRLVPLPRGRTRLEGSTWYELSMAPQTYWAFFADLLIHQIHQRVLDHIRAEVSAARAPAAK
jgi:uncharacterized membrane protein YhaH (DUF805 family)/uncharacterized protein YndB with AHSA1/START domain